MFEKFLDLTRFILYLLLGLIGMLLFQAWNAEHSIPAMLRAPDATQDTLSYVASHSYAPSTSHHPFPSSSQATPISVPSLPLPVKKIQRIQVTTNVLNTTIDLQDGAIIENSLMQYATALNDPRPYVLLNPDSTTYYTAESILLPQQKGKSDDMHMLFSSLQKQYVLQPNQHHLIVKLYWKNSSGISIIKSFDFTQNSYEIHVSYQIINHSTETWKGNLYTQLTRSDAPVTKQESIVPGLTTYFGAALSSPEKSFQKIPFKNMRETNFKQIVQGGWVAMIQHYFVSAWIPPHDSTNVYYSRATPDGLYTIGVARPTLVVPAGNTHQIEAANLFTGPALSDQLGKAAKTLPLTIDYGLFWFISVIILWMMNKIFYLIGNWGWSIVLVTVIIKLLFYQLSAKSYRSMNSMKKLQPSIEKLKELYGENKQQLTQATLALYRQEKVNPMSGCLPILIQIPVFIALYWVLIESIQLRHAPFILWIKDLSQYDPYYCLPILMGASMFLQQRLNPPPSDPTQAKIMLCMPIVFTGLFIHFPAGLMLYWFINNTLSFLQQWFVIYQIQRQSSLE